MAKSVKIAIVGDTAGLKRALDSADGQLARFEGTVGRTYSKLKMGAVAFGAAGTAAVLFGKSAFDAFSDLNEAANKTDVVFGKAAASVKYMTGNAAKGLGMTRTEALGAAATFGNLFRAMKLSEDQSADMSLSLVKLSSDLASFNNVEPAEALEALRSAMTGEAEPMRRFGVNINEAKIKAEALALGLTGVKGELTDAAKAQAIYSIVMRESSLAQGDFANTADGAANQQRILKAQFSELQAQLGERLYPVGVAVLGALNDGLTNISSWWNENGAAVMAAMSDAWDKMKQKFTDMFGEDPFGNFMTGAQAVSAWADDMRGRIEQANNEFERGATIVYKTIGPAWEWLGGVLIWIKDEVLDPMWGWIVNNVIPGLGMVAENVGGAFIWIKDEVLDPFIGVLQTIMDWVTRILEGVTNMIKRVEDSQIVKMLTGHGGSVAGIVGGQIRPPGFAVGGMVPGPVGSPSLAIVHGGEKVLTPRQQQQQSDGGGPDRIVIELDGRVVAEAVYPHIRRREVSRL